ncbi:AIPR family protein [Bifidobacterium choladohabitans]|nr:AIPR family protein [Bifidobacterium choladohabitans]MBI0148051.1 AIPR family protein [Bifidobacterium sp. W8104]
MTGKLNMTQATIRNFVESERSRIDKNMGADEAFERVVAQQVLTQYLLDDDEVTRGMTDGGLDGGYDGIFIFVNDTLMNGEDPKSISLDSKSQIDIHLIQSKNQAHFSEAIVQNWKVSFPNLVETDQPDKDRYNQAVIDLFELIRIILEQTIKKRLQVSIHFWAVSLALKVHPNLLKQAEELKELVESIIPSKNTSVHVDFVTAKNLFELIEEAPDETVSLKGTKEPLCPDESSAILTVLLGDYFSFITDEKQNLKKSLFEANIRDYQGKVHVNKAIHETLENKSDIDFWWLNNGITIVADKVTRDMGNSISLTNPRIVNGLQTSNEIAQYCKSEKSLDDNRTVLIKCIASSDHATRAKIIQATNNQTSIPPAFLHSLETIHLQIERYFTDRHLQYDRRKSTGKNNGWPAKDIISISFLGQCLISTLLGQPDYARARPAQILGDEKKYARIFNEHVPLEAYYRLARTSANIKQLIKGCGLTRGEQNDLLFHTIYLYCAKDAGSLKVGLEDLVNLHQPKEKEFKEVVDLAKSVYLENGGNAQTAKNASFVVKLQERAADKWGLRQ